ncbi:MULTISPECIES: EAL domain-containing protein [unclassified Vibrio]|uniref:EAL domain-containing protein n=1 Tax=Vibrio sp. HB236076 TaxID=3232307 RepID=A0AB39HEX1_9VIBR|nr:EAL domain-containing protein [Vibrio sp. HB161653]MDP5255379.1 EAL domain-containing protein [Vibrio sp. HB161653]
MIKINQWFTRNYQYYFDRTHIAKFIALCGFITVLLYVCLVSLHSRWSLDEKIHHALDNFNQLLHQERIAVKTQLLGISPLDCPTYAQQARQAVYNSNYIDAIGLVNRYMVLTCSSYLENVNIDLVAHYPIGEIKEDSIYQVVPQYTDKTSMLFFTGLEKGYWASMIMPLRHVRGIFEKVFDTENIAYRILVNQDVIDHNGKLTDGRIVVSDADGPQIEIEPNAQYYLGKLVECLPYLIIVLLIQAVVIIYIMYRTKSQSLNILVAQAYQKREFNVYLQAIVNNHQSSVIGYEALLRWYNPAQGVVSPLVFIPVLENIQLIDKVTYQVFEDALALIKKHSQHFADKYISVNLSRVLLDDCDALSRIITLLNDHNALCSSIVIEITENLELDEKKSNNLSYLMSSLRPIGVRFSIDDFGTGYSGLSLIKDHRFDYLKIDKVFINQVGQNGSSDLILNHVMQIAKDFSMGTIVEGVETTRQVTALETLGFDVLQGFYFHKPDVSSQAIEYSDNIFPS